MPCLSAIYSNECSPNPKSFAGMVFPKCWIGLVWTVAFCVAQTQALLSEDELVRWAGLDPIHRPIMFLLFIFGRNLKEEPTKILMTSSQGTACCSGSRGFWLHDEGSPPVRYHHYQQQHLYSQENFC